MFDFILKFLIKLNKRTRTLVIAFIIAPSVVIFCIVLVLFPFFIYEYRYYVTEDIDDIDYAEPTEQAKRFDLEKYINDLPPVKYEKINFPVKETIKYEFNGYILTMDIPEGYEYSEIPRDEKNNRVENSIETPNLDDPNNSGKGFDPVASSVISDKLFCIKNIESKSSNCDISIMPTKSSHKKISMKDIFMEYELGWFEKYKHKTSNFDFLLQVDEKHVFNDKNFYYYNVSLLLSDQQEVFFRKGRNLSEDLFFSMLDTVRIEKIKKKSVFSSIRKFLRIE